MELSKIIIPAAGLGTRFLPFSKSVPKEMVPLLNKPAMQYIIEEGLASGIDNFLMITSKHKQAIANHFDSDMELDFLLKEKNQLDLISSLEKIIRTANFTYLRQTEPLGLGHAIWLARHNICKEYFGVILPDDIIVSKQPAFEQLLKVARQERASVIAVEEVPAESISSYGIIGIKKQITPNLFQISHLVEKPAQKDAPSNLAIVGRYILSPKLFAAFEEIETDERGELQLTDAISTMIRNNEKVFAFKVQGIRHDLGNPIGWIKAIIACALQDPYYAPHIRKLLEDQDMLNKLMFTQTKLTEHSI